MDKMLDAGSCLPAIGFAVRRGGRGYSILKGSYPCFIQHQASCIQYLLTLVQMLVSTRLSFFSGFSLK
jgi:hypothetical protein